MQYDTSISTLIALKPLTMLTIKCMGSIAIAFLIFVFYNPVFILQITNLRR